MNGECLYTKAAFDKTDLYYEMKKINERFDASADKYEKENLMKIISKFNDYLIKSCYIEDVLKLIREYKNK